MTDTDIPIGFGCFMLLIVAGILALGYLVATDDSDERERQACVDRGGFVAETHSTGVTSGGQVVSTTGWVCLPQGSR